MVSGADQMDNECKNKEVDLMKWLVSVYMHLLIHFITQSCGSWQHMVQWVALPYSPMGLGSFPWIG